VPYLNNNGVRIYYRTEGAGPPVVLMHGTSGNMEDWREYGYVDALKSSYLAVLIDSRGHGYSDKPHDPAAYALRLRVSDVTAVLDALRIEKAHYAGYSMGGWIGFGMAKHAPHRVLSLSLGGAHPYEDKMALVQGQFSRGMETYIAETEAQGMKWPAERRMRKLANDPQAVNAATGPRPGGEDVLPLISVPCLLYSGDADPRLPLAKKAAASIKGSRFAVIPGADHLEAFVRGDLVLPHISSHLAAATSRLTPRPTSAV
jgi:pimeloyl-ACP methyl ester carboxylesterase